jgi:hypothetical protein
MKLQDLGKKYGTDKSRHSYKNMSYLDIYERYFEKRRLEIKTFVEIGILNGNSLKTWAEYFPNAIIYGIDINPDCKKYELDRVKIFIGDQNDHVFLKQIMTEIPKIDILLDDGSHITSHQIKTFNYLNQNIQKNGFYVIEDLRNSYEEFFNHHNVRNIWPGMVYNDSKDELKNYRTDFNNWVQKMIKDLDFHNQDTNLFSIHFYPMIIIFENK